MRFDLTPLHVTDHAGRVLNRKFADEGSARQEGSKPVFSCSCGQPLVWVTSNRTGRKYLAECFARASSSLYYVKASPHTTEHHEERNRVHAAFMARNAG